MVAAGSILPSLTSLGMIHRYCGLASLFRNGTNGCFSLKTTVEASG